MLFSKQSVVLVHFHQPFLEFEPHWCLDEMSITALRFCGFARSQM